MTNQPLDKNTTATSQPGIPIPGTCFIDRITGGKIEDLVGMGRAILYQLKIRPEAVTNMQWTM